MRALFGGRVKLLHFLVASCGNAIGRLWFRVAEGVRSVTIWLVPNLARSGCSVKAQGRSGRKKESCCVRGRGANVEICSRQPTIEPEPAAFAFSVL